MTEAQAAEATTLWTREAGLGRDHRVVGLGGRVWSDFVGHADDMYDTVEFE